MIERAYLSNISPLWPLKRQEQALAAAFPAWPKGVVVFRDEIDGRDRRGHSPALLTARASMLRATSRKSAAERITLASLAVLAWSAEDMLECLTLALDRGATVRVLDAEISIPPTPDAAVLHAAAKAFREARTRQIEVTRGKAGGTASAAAKRAEAEQRALTIRDAWALPSEEYPTAVLLERAGISRNTAKLYLGKRHIAQAAHLTSIKRKAARAAKGTA